MKTPAYYGEDKPIKNYNNQLLGEIFKYFHSSGFLDKTEKFALREKAELLEHENNRWLIEKEK